MKIKFEEIGYSKDFYNKEEKYIGSLVCEKDREVYGYLGRKKEILTIDIVLRKKKIKKGTELSTEIFPLCGRIIK
jgi:hypothetical protein